jgi:DNA-binding transcriptional ArsR family regulator
VSNKEPDVASLELVTVLQALSDPVRLDIVRQLAACPDTDEPTCGQLVVGVSKSTTSHHLKTLTAAGIVGERAEGTRKHLRLRREDLEARFPGLLDSVLGAARAA